MSAASWQAFQLTSIICEQDASLGLRAEPSHDCLCVPLIFAKPAFYPLVPHFQTFHVHSFSSRSTVLTSGSCWYEKVVVSILLEL